MEPALRAAFADSKIAESPAIFRLVVDVVKGKKNVPQVLKTISKNKHLKNLPGASKSNICRLVIKGKAVVIQGKAAGAAWCDEHDARATSDRAEPVGTCPNVVPGVGGLLFSVWALVAPLRGGGAAVN